MKLELRGRKGKGTKRNERGWDERSVSDSRSFGLDLPGGELGTEERREKQRKKKGQREDEGETTRARTRTREEEGETGRTDERLDLPSLHGSSKQELRLPIGCRT